MDRPLHADDIVVSKADQSHLAVVERTHADVDTHDPYPGRAEPDPIKHARDISPPAFKKFIKDGIPPKGTVMVRWTHSINAELISTSKLRLLDRSLLVGDVVKRDSQAESGVVVNTFTKCTLQPMGDVKYRGSELLKGLLPPGDHLTAGIKHAGSPRMLTDIPASELMYTEVPAEEDLVIYKDWIGRIEAVTYHIALKLSDSTVVEISDEHAEHADDVIDGFKVGDIVVSKKGTLRTGKWIFGQYNPNTHPVGTVMQLRPVAAEVSWLQRRIGSVNDTEPSVTLEREELESEAFMIYDRTRRPPKEPLAGTEQQTQSTSNSEFGVRLRDRVRFKDVSGACVKYDGSTSHSRLPRIDRQATLGYDINVFDIVSFHTDVTIQWQDLSITQEDSIDLIPDMSIDDDHAAWPGEIAHTLDVTAVSGFAGVEQPSKVGVIQSVKAAERMAKILWCPNAIIQYSVDSDEETGEKSLVMGAMGSTTGEMEELSLYDLEAPAAMNVRRGDMVLIANKTLTDLGGAPGPEKREWLGEIVDTRLDGTLVIRLGATDVVQDVKVRREDIVVAIRSDGTADIDAWEENSFSDDAMDGPEVALDGSGNLGVWHGHGDDGEENDSWDDEDDYDSEDDEDEDEEPQARYEDENGESMDEDEVENEDWESEEEDKDTNMVNTNRQQTPPTSHSVTPTGAGRQQQSETEDAMESSQQASGPPPAYLVLDHAIPASHHYASQMSSASPTHMKRVQKEHRILQKPAAIPPGVFVRTWESRLDLIRVLFIGPSDTPYDNAPFVVDLYLPPQFPTEPPHAFFHSWTGESGMGGVGRINPNLYEDGKICLSLLGTWEGNKGEGWNAARSTVLQVVVSLLGLVLVREPYFNEAGYEHLAGLEASKRPSALYNERTYLRSRGFVITALSRLSGGDGGKADGLEGVEDVIRWSYTSSDGPRLVDKVVTDVETALKRSDEGSQETDGLTVMSKGACIPLRRVVGRLKQWQQ